MKHSQISSAALIALRDALVKIYWYKSDLRTFLNHAIGDKSVVNNLDWSGLSKRDIVASLVDDLTRNEAIYQDNLLNLMKQVVLMAEFDHLEKLDEGEKKVKEAKKSVAELKSLYSGHDKLIKEKEKAQEQRVAAQVALARNIGIKKELAVLEAEVGAMVGMKDARARGYKLEKVLNELFKIFELNPKSPFKIYGEQIDGAFTFEGTEYLLEAKWENAPVERKELDTFNAKIERKLENTLGLFFSFNGFAVAGVDLLSGSRPRMILMDGEDLMAVLEERIDLHQMLSRKRRHASTTGRILLRFRDF